MSSAPRIIIKPSPDISPDQACDIRAHAWKFIFDRWNVKKAITVTSANVVDDVKFANKERRL